jgi:tetratricopeptide (TPR) repeat protein
MIVRRLGAAAVLLGSCLSVAANTPQNISAAEISKLPPYCPAAQTFSTGGFPEGPLPQQRPWVAKMGRAFWAIHHYCWALVSARRATAPGVKDHDRQFLYGAAIADIHFVLNHAQPGFVLLPELYLRMGDYHLAVARYGEALEWYERARVEKADYWPPYVRAAELLGGALNRRADAIKLLQEGAQRMPAEKRFAEALKKLGASPAAMAAPTAASAVATTAAAAPVEVSAAAAPAASAASRP